MPFPSVFAAAVEGVALAIVLFCFHMKEYLWRSPIDEARSSYFTYFLSFFSTVVNAMAISWTFCHGTDKGCGGGEEGRVVPIFHPSSFSPGSSFFFRARGFSVKLWFARKDKLRA